MFFADMDILIVFDKEDAVKYLKQFFVDLKTSPIVRFFNFFLGGLSIMPKEITTEDTEGTESCYFLCVLCALCGFPKPNSQKIIKSLPIVYRELMGRGDEIGY